jgi:hypothetical protein
MSDQPAKAEPIPAARSLWLCLSNVCARGSFKVSLDIDGAERVLFLQNVEQDEGVVSHGFNLTPYLQAHASERYRGALQRLLEVIDPANTEAVNIVAAALGASDGD